MFKSKEGKHPAPLHTDEVIESSQAGRNLIRKYGWMGVFAVLFAVLGVSSLNGLSARALVDNNQLFLPFVQFVTAAIYLLMFLSTVGRGIRLQRGTAKAVTLRGAKWRNYSMCLILMCYVILVLSLTLDTFLFIWLLPTLFVTLWGIGKIKEWTDERRYRGQSTVWVHLLYSCCILCFIGVVGRVALSSVRHTENPSVMTYYEQGRTVNALSMLSLGITNEDDIEDIWFEEKKSILVDTYFNYYECSETQTIDQYYYDCRTAYVADAIWEELWTRYAKENVAYAELVAIDPTPFGADEAYFNSGHWKNQLLLRKGNQILLLRKIDIAIDEPKVTEAIRKLLQH